MGISFFITHIYFSIQNSVSHLTTRIQQLWMNPMALLPYGIYICWNVLNLCSIPKSVRYPAIPCFAILIFFEVVWCSLSNLFTISFQPYLWWDILGSNIALGYTIEAPPCSENTIICCWPYTSGLCNADGWYSECAQFDNEQYGWYRLQLACRYACTTSSTWHIGLYPLYIYILKNSTGNPWTHSRWT